MSKAQLGKQIFYGDLPSDILAMQIKKTAMIYCNTLKKHKLLLSTLLMDLI